MKSIKRRVFGVQNAEYIDPLNQDFAEVVLPHIREALARHPLAKRDTYMDRWEVYDSVYDKSTRFPTADVAITIWDNHGKKWDVTLMWEVGERPFAPRHFVLMED